MTSRRHVLAGLALAPWVAAGRNAPLLAATGFSPPSATMRLTRRLVRHMRGGATIDVSRGWDIAITPLGRGFSVAGRQAEVSVEAPPGLEALGKIEAERVEEGMFPLPLDERGLLLSSGSAASDDAIDQSVARIREEVAARTWPEDRAAAIAAFAQMLQRAGPELLSAWPVDLFSPASPQGEVERSVGPDGATSGTIRVSTTTERDAFTGVMRRYDRRIESRVGDSARLSEELWSITP